MKHLIVSALLLACAAAQAGWHLPIYVPKPGPTIIPVRS